MAKKKRERKERERQQKEGEMALANEIAQYIFDWKRLENRCLTSIQAYVEMAKTMPNAVVVDGATDNPYIFIDNGAAILGVAHLDTVAKSNHFAHIEVAGDFWVIAAQLDDRLGVFLLLDVLRHLGMKYDVLLTTGEESGRSSAKKFKPPEGKQYNWMFECDRMETDVVHYQYDGHKWLKAIRDAGFNRISRGSYTDIASLDNLGMCGLNMGVGYTDYHGVWAKANMSDCARQVMKLSRFYDENKDTLYEYDAKAVRSFSYPHGQGVEGFGYPGSYNHYGIKDEDHVFETDQWVKIKATGILVQVNSRLPQITYMTDGSRMRKWFCKIPSNHPAVNSFSSFLESELEAVPTPPPDIEDTQPVKPVEQRTIPKAERDVLVMERRTHELQHSRSSILAKRELCEADGLKLTTTRARWDYENWMFGDVWVQWHSSETNKNTKYPIEQPFEFGQRVMTAFGLGTVDCTLPLVVASEEYQWWVRMDAPDANGWFCQLVYESEITAHMQPILLGPVYEEVSAQENPQ